MFSAAEYQLKEKRQHENRKPAAFPDEKSLETLRSYLIAEIKRAIAKKDEQGTLCPPPQGCVDTVNTAQRKAR